MKKSLIALAIAGAMTAPVVAQADATLYGKVSVDAIFKNDTSADIQVDDAIIGVKGTVDLGLGETTGFYNIRTELSAEGAVASGGHSLTTDRALVGMTGGWGTFQAGAMGNPVDAVESLDAYSDSYSTNNWFVNPDDLQSAAAYVTPSMGGFTGYAGIVVDGGIEDGSMAYNDEDFDGYVVGFNYGIAGLSLDVGYWAFDKQSTVGADVTEADYVGVSASYAFTDAFSVTANYAESNADDIDADTELWGLGAEYSVGATTFGATYLDFEATQASTTLEEGDEWGVYVNHKLGKMASVYAQYSTADIDGGSVAGEDVFNMGYSISF